MLGIDPTSTGSGTGGVTPSHFLELGGVKVPPKSLPGAAGPWFTDLGPLLKRLRTTGSRARAYHNSA